jgi:ribonuclease VapC
MILGTSAIVAIIIAEPEAKALLRALAGAKSPVKLGAPTKVESGMVLGGRLGLRGKTLLSQFLAEQEVEIVEFRDEHAEEAIRAFRRFGKGQHPAGLNMGDCYLYATAALARESLLCLGDDFPQTDLALVDLNVAA